MRNELEKFNETVSILVKAYLNDELAHGTCYACAVGNIIRSSGCNLPYDSNENSFWLQYINAKHRGLYWYDNGSHDIGKKQIDATGYSSYELHLIERSFESVPRGNNDDEWMFNGLMAVLDTLAKIHGIDLETTEKAKLQFVK